MNAFNNERLGASCPTLEAGTVIAHKLNGLELSLLRGAAVAKSPQTTGWWVDEDTNWSAGEVKTVTMERNIIQCAAVFACFLC